MISPKRCRRAGGVAEQGLRLDHVKAGSGYFVPFSIIKIGQAMGCSRDILHANACWIASSLIWSLRQVMLSTSTMTQATRSLSAVAASPRCVIIKSACSINNTPPYQPYAYTLFLRKEHAPDPLLLLWIGQFHLSQTSCWTVKRCLTSITLSRCNIDTSLPNSHWKWLTNARLWPMKFVHFIFWV